MARSGKTPKTGEPGPFEFPLVAKKRHEARKKELAFAHSEDLKYQFQRVREMIDWDALRNASTEDEIHAALSSVDQSTRAKLPNSAAILATVKDPDYPKLRPIPFLARSCALSLQTSPKTAEEYSTRYSRDLCYGERKRRGPQPKPMKPLEYWLEQAKNGQLVPREYARRINRILAKEKRKSEKHEERIKLTYVDIPTIMESVKKKRTTVWLPETTIEKLKKLSALTGAPMAELFRRAVEAYVNKQ
jgi:Ribbon-helix-helix protein, copG family